MSERDKGIEAKRTGEKSQRVDFRNRIISPPVAGAMDDSAAVISVIISLEESADHPERGLQESKDQVLKVLKDVHPRSSQFYVFAKLTPKQISDLAVTCKQWVRHIWKDETCEAHLLQSTVTIQANASWMTFAALGEGITWAVMDTGIQADHPHFEMYHSIDAKLSRDFSYPDDPGLEDPLKDQNGHGTFVAGIIAGALKLAPGQTPKATFTTDSATEVKDLAGCPSGVAPKCKLVSIKVLDATGHGDASSAIQGLEYLRSINAASREIKIDGVNLSLGYPFDPKWFGCGHSPLCEEVNRAVRAGIVVVVSCGNSGYGQATLDTGNVVPVSIGLSIADPANAEEAIAVGSVHKSSPFTYGISYFSSKGPTGDGRMKPDLVAPGEKVISCSIDGAENYSYREDSGTSMAAPHVSGAIAAYLSVRREFRGHPDKLKEVFKQAAVDLGRDRSFQGAGLLDLYRALTTS
jgi:serine protease AprX